MKFFFVITTLITFLLTPIAANEVNNVYFQELDKVIAEKNFYVQQKMEQIDRLKSGLPKESETPKGKRFQAVQKIHEAYFTFNYDSAMKYALELHNMARQFLNPQYLSLAKLKLSATLLASGIFNEAKDTLESINADVLPDSMKIEYYYDFSRLYFDMVDYYQRSFLIDKYIKLGLQYLDTALMLTPENSVKQYSLTGLKMVRLHNYQQARENYRLLFGNFNPEGRQFAIDASTYGFVLEQNGRLEEGMQWLIKAAIEDIKLANRENVALINLANKLFDQGKIERASEYLNVALEDASTYGALQRKFQISQIQPIVEATRLQMTEAQKMRFKRLTLIVSVLSFVIVVILFALLVQFKKLKTAQWEINKTNARLKSNNEKLREVNLIKNEYIGQFFKTNSDLIEKLDFFRQHIENKVMTRRFDELNNLLKKQNIKEEREAMYRNFDSVFLSIFPDFVEKFNALFDEKNRVELKHSEQMNTDLRIFALIRLGISDTEKIAHILDYSVNTINTYKTKIKNRSVVSNDEFEKEILKIQSI
ncbi:MAG: DUF6377 domain-containing protein [Prolixibacteraceae bacterium]|nr:DUF6377 domain-containing protein [Prolixibacteraceae bacterium]